MKKLSLKKLNLHSNDLLQREQLKTVFGGYGGGGGKQCAGCTKNSDCAQGVCGGNAVACSGVPKDHCVY